MSQSLFSSSWHRVAQLKPRLRSHTRLHRHHYRGARWYVLHDLSKGGRCHRLSPAAHTLIGLMDGVRTTQEIWDAATELLGDDVPTQDETIRLLGLLHLADALRCDVTPETEQMFERRERQEAGEWWQRILNPLSLRFSLFDPDRFLERWSKVVRPAFSKLGATVWCSVVGLALVLAATHWEDLANEDLTALFGGGNLLILWLVFPIVKALHEFGHAFAAKIWGAEVHEMGLMFLVLMPVPYVDASAVAVFPDKWRRMIVGAAGIAVELFLASLALFVWLAVEPGFVRSVAVNVMAIASVSTLLFNGNPLLRFDGYFVLSDAIEIPNLAMRSKQYLTYLLERYVFGIEQVRNPVSGPGERSWFVGYGVASALYRIALVLGIALFISTRFFVVGLLLALLSLTMQIGLPTVKRISFLLTDPRLGESRARAIALSGSCAACIALFVLALPLPLYTVTEGVLWLPEDARVRAGADAFVTSVLAASGAQVKSGDALISTRDPFLDANVAALEAELSGLRARRHSQQQSDLVQAQITQEEISSAKARLRRARERSAESVLRASTDGAFVVPRSDLEGRFVKQGEVVGFIVGSSTPIARVVVSQAAISLVRQRTEAVEVRLSSRLSKPLPARIVREIPGAGRKLPSPALGSSGGGSWAVDPRDADGVRSIEPVFQLELELPETPEARAIGQRVHVRFAHGNEPIAYRAYRSLHRLLTSRLSG